MRHPLRPLCEAIGSNVGGPYSAVKVERILLTYVALGLLVLATIPLRAAARLRLAHRPVVELEAIAAVIGGTALKGGFGRVWGTVVGVLILSLIGNTSPRQSGLYLNGDPGRIMLAVLQRKKTSAGGV